MGFHSSNNLNKILYIFVLFVFLLLTGCTNKKSYVYEEDSILSIEVKEMTDNGWVVITKILDDEKGEFLSDLSAITFKKGRSDRKEAPTLVIEITFKDKSYDQISYFGISKFTNDSNLISLEIYVCPIAEFMDLVNKYKI